MRTGSAIAVGLILLMVGCDQIERAKQKETVSEMAILLGVLSYMERPSPDEAMLEHLLETHGDPYEATDAWGSPYEILHGTASDGWRLEIRSYGADKKRGNCCTQRVDSAKEDAVLRDGEWLQVWRLL